MRQLLYKDPAVFFAGVLATQLPGYLSPLYWAVYPVFASFVAAGPLTCMMDMKPGFGSAAIFPVLWFIVYRCMGELGMPVMWVICFTFIIAAEIIRKLMGYSDPGSIRASVPVASLSAGCMVLPLYRAAMYTAAQLSKRANAGSLSIRLPAAAGMI